MAENKQRRLPNTPWQGNASSDRENASRSDGASLALGSTEYRERVADLKGMDEFEQERHKLADAGLRRTEAFTPTDKRAEAHDEMVGRHAEEIRERFEDDGYGVLSTSERVVSHEVRKGIAAERVLDHAEAVAAHTETKEDDKFVSRRLPKELKEAVYDEGKGVEDIYPGMSTLEKYM